MSELQGDRESCEDDSNFQQGWPEKLIYLHAFLLRRNAQDLNVSLLFYMDHSESKMKGLLSC